MSKIKILAQGAEAIIQLDKNIITKNRIPKSYRLKELDEKLRKSRTKREAKLLTKASEIINSPKPLTPQVDFTKIKMPFIDGEKLSETLNTYNKNKQFQIMRQIGKQTAKLHENNIIHGDLTTSNIILKNNKIFIIDFGLGFVSQRIEDKAVDLHLIKQALEAKHFQNPQQLFKEFLKAYKWGDYKKVLGQLKKVESRGRYKH